MSTTPSPSAAGLPGAAGLTDLLGDSRARIVEALRGGEHTVAELAGVLGVSEVAVRRHLGVLERDGLVTTGAVRRDGPGRPSASYGLTDRGLRLFPDRTGEFANELLSYLEEEHGRGALLGFLRWRQAQQGSRYAAALAPYETDDVAGRAGELAALLDADGFMSDVEATPTPDGRTQLTLRQGHCAIQEVAEAYPEVCAYEAALFRDLLGAKVSRRQTIAAGANACICHISYDDANDRSS